MCGPQTKMVSRVLQSFLAQNKNPFLMLTKRKPTLNLTEPNGSLPYGEISVFASLITC